MPVADVPFGFTAWWRGQADGRAVGVVATQERARLRHWRKHAQLSTDEDAVVPDKASSTWPWWRSQGRDRGRGGAAAAEGTGHCGAPGNRGYGSDVGGGRPGRGGAGQLIGAGRGFCFFFREK